MRQYFIKAAKFGDAENRLLDIFHLTFLNDIEFWSIIIREDKGTFLDMGISIGFAAEQLPKIASLLESEDVHAFRSARDKESHATTDLLSVVVLEEHGVASTPQRLTLVLQSVSDLYEACAIIESCEADRLRVIACDSGSDKSFDFLGAAKAIECMKDVILSLWDRIVYYREHKVANRIELVAKALPVLDRIADLGKSAKLGREQAELLRRQITGGMR